MASPRLVAASQFAFEQKSRSRVTIRRRKPQAHARRPGLQPTGGRRREQCENRAPQGGGSGLGLGLARSGAGNPLPLQGERDAPVPFQAGQQSEHGGSLAQGTFPQLPQELARGHCPSALTLEMDFLELFLLTAFPSLSSGRGHLGTRTMPQFSPTQAQALAHAVGLLSAQRGKDQPAEPLLGAISAAKTSLW